MNGLANTLIYIKVHCSKNIEISELTSSANQMISFHIMEKIVLSSFRYSNQQHAWQNLTPRKSLH